MKRFVLLIIVCCSLWNLYAQYSAKEQPFGFNVDFEKCSLSSITLSTSDLPDMKLVEKEDLLYDQEDGFQRVAYPVRVNYSLNNSGCWEELPDGSRLWRLEITLPGALLTSVMYNQFWLPKGAKFWVYNKKRQNNIMVL